MDRNGSCITADKAFELHLLGHIDFNYFNQHPVRNEDMRIVSRCFKESIGWLVST